jgi:hypothetical protein
MMFLMVFLNVFGPPQGRSKMGGGPVKGEVFVALGRFYDCLRGD